jgi:hypothetical protein
MELKLEPGFYEVELRYQWTRYFTVGVVLSIFSILALVLFWLKTPKTSMSLSEGEPSFNMFLYVENSTKQNEGLVG